MGALVERHYGCCSEFGLVPHVWHLADVLGQVAADEIERLSCELLVLDAARQSETARARVR